MIWMNSIYKNAIAAAFMKVCTNKNMADITTNDITEACGISRQTFYNYFPDKYAVVSYLFDVAAQRITEPLSSGLGTVYSTIHAMLENVQNNRSYYQSIARFQGQNSFEDYFCAYSIAYYAHLIKKYHGEDALTPAIQFEIEFNCYAVTKIFIQWILNGAKDPTEQLAKKMTDAMPSRMKTLLSIDEAAPGLQS